MKKTLSFLLAFLMIVTMVPVVAITSFASTEVTQISSKEDFLNKIGAAAGNYVLTQDIDLDGMVINTYAVLLKAGTTIDGAGHSIYNYSVKYDATNSTYTPEKNNIAMSLFALEKTADATYTIQNLTVGKAAAQVAVDFAVWGSAASPLVAVVPAGTTLNVTNVTSYANFTNNATNGAKSAAAIVAFTYGEVTIDGCSAYGNVVCNVSAGNNPRGVAGILGDKNSAASVTIQNCTNYATVTGVNRVGGIIGCAGGADSTVTISNCANYGTVNSTGDGVGAMIGWSWGDRTTTTISGSVNYAPVTAGPGGAAAAFIGYTEGTSPTFNLTNCENHGAIKGKYAAAGIANMDAGTDATLNVTNLFNTAKLDGSDSRAAVVVAKNELKIKEGPEGNQVDVFYPSKEINITGVVNLGDVAGKWQSGALVGCSRAAKITITNSYMVGKIAVTGSIVDPMVYYAGTEDKSVVLAESSGNYHNQDFILDNSTNDTLSTAKTVAELLEMLNANETITNAYGVFKYKTDAKNALVQATPAIKGIQFGKVSGEGENATYSARLVATIQDTLYYENIGFEVTVSGKTAKIHYSANVYGTIYGNENGLITYTAQELGGEYVYGLVINNIPADEAVTLTIRTYAKDKAVDGEGAAIEYFGAAQTITIQNGALVENAQ